MDNTLRMIGLAMKAGRLEAGEEPAGQCCREKRCRLLLTASDAAEGTLRRAEHFAAEGACLLAGLPFSKEELGGAIGRASCAVAAMTDLGMAQAVVQKLAAADPERYRETAEKASRRRAAGCVCVDMECSAVAALAQFRGKEVFQFFHGADSLDGERWDRRGLGSEFDLTEKDKIAQLALELAAEIA